jgi:hypothetical protein
MAARVMSQLPLATSQQRLLHHAGQHALLLHKLVQQQSALLCADSPAKQWLQLGCCATAVWPAFSVVVGWQQLPLWPQLYED